MNSELLDIIIPSIAFFALIFAVFTFLEAFLSYFLIVYVFGKWNLLSNLSFRNQIQQNPWIKEFSIYFLVIFLGAVVWFTSFFEILKLASSEEKFFSGVTLLLVILIYLFNRDRLTTSFKLLRQIHRYLFIYVSTIVYIITVLLTNQYYGDFKGFINANVVAPAVDNGRQVLESRKRKRLLTEFRQQIYQDDCSRVDYTADPGSDSLHFVYVATHQDIRINSRPIVPTDQSAFLSGRLCSNASERFLLTDYGQWYWVISAS